MDIRISPTSFTGQSPLSERTVAPLLSASEHKELVASSQSLHAARNTTKARVLLVEWPQGAGRRAVLKDGSQRAWWFRVLFGRHQMKREWKALTFLKDMPGVPAAYFWAGADAFGMEWFQGQPLLRFAPGELPPVAIEKLEAAMNDLHARGVTHGDLHRDNVLFDADSERIWLIDWATSCVFGTRRRGFKAWMWREWQALDRRALAKIKARYAPELLRDEERFLLENGGTTLSRLVRRVGAIIKRRKRIRQELQPASSSHASA